MRNGCKILVGKPEVKRPLGRPRHRWENIKINLTEIWWEGVDCRAEWRALLNTVMNLRIP
jgi:hypothetical protein